MANDEANPYKAPNLIDAGSRSVPAVIRALIRVAMMGAVGFISFTTMGLSYWAAAEYFQLEIFPSLSWALGIGAIGAAIFLGSEAFNSGEGKKPGFLWRFVASLALIFISAIICSAITTVLGWNPPRRRYEESNPYWIHQVFVFGVVAVAVFAVARRCWMAERQGQN